MKDQMHATITALRFATEDGQQAATEALSVLLHQALEVTGLLDCWVVRIAPRESAMFTLYSSESAAETAAQLMRQRLAAAIGAYVSGPPHRRAGTVVASTTQ